MGERYKAYLAASSFAQVFPYVGRENVRCLNAPIFSTQTFGVAQQTGVHK
jgi:hypothetical protein